jgi:glycosyltransferase involved in cell wall biosynthesis
MDQLTTNQPQPAHNEDVANVDQIKVSVVMPVHNAGDRICKCLDTLVNQTLREIEIICVLDCPTDGTDKIVEEYAAKDNRIVVVRNKCNLHISASRNEGMKRARGEYIGFSDHDDYRALDMYEKLYAKAKETDADVVVSDVKQINEDMTEEYFRFNDFSQNGLINSIVLPFEDDRNLNKVSRACWHAIYKKSFLNDNAIVFEDRRKYFEEDTLFNLKVAVYARQLAYVNEVLYCWNNYHGSESHSIYTHEERAARLLAHVKYVNDTLVGAGLFEAFKEQLWVYVSKVINYHYPQYKNLQGTEKEVFAKLINDIHFPLWGRYNLKLLSKKRIKLFFFLLKIRLDDRKAK